MQFRHEVKHEISAFDAIVLRQRLKAVMTVDSHAIDGKYLIRSLYFDNIQDKALEENLNGANKREKYRIRCYNSDKGFISLERKYKSGGLGFKDSATLTEDETEAIIKGDIQWMAKSSDPVILGLYTKMKTQGLRPRTIVEYTREPFIYGPGNVRVTIDSNIKTGIRCIDFLNIDAVTIPIKENISLLEVKWDNYLPDIIRNAVQLESGTSRAFSKYVACRMYD